MYFRGENTSLNFGFYPHRLRTLFIHRAVYCMPLVWFAFATLHTVSVFAIVWRGSFVYDLLSLLH